MWQLKTVKVIEHTHKNMNIWNHVKLKKSNIGKLYKVKYLLNKAQNKEK